ncbi:MAG: D-hexose-6-phosphate mutarotase [Planctomycetota bacterium]|nr:MAG: D-hexose-6-phosphate mutarotase [Planctomycetota bacterium]
MPSLSDLQRRFAIPGVVQVDSGAGSLPRVVVTGDHASAEIYLHGAQLTQFQPKGAKPVLFMSGKSWFEANKPIRGGVPVCFPWFGPKAGSPELPAHGFARIRDWDLESCVRQPDGAVRVAFALDSEESDLRLTFTIGRSLEMEFDVRSKTALTFEEALHTYFLVGDVRRVGVEGLENTDYLDKTDSFRRKTQPAEPIRITAETDRIYPDTRTACVVRDPVLERTIRVEKEGSDTTVVWNPWIAKAKAMPDFGDDEWPEMICVETANVGDRAVRLQAGETHRMKVRITVS